MIVVTTEAPPGRVVEEVVGLVSDSCVRGVNVIRETLARWTNFVGGRSESVRKEMDRAVAEAVEGLARQARGHGADAVVAVRAQPFVVPYRDGFMVGAVAVGTAVTLRR
jgi:uncharacterized protein YbjQ (UPF0145 family)